MNEVWSGRRGSNPRPTAWEAVTLPLSYSRPVVTPDFSRRRGRLPALRLTTRRGQSDSAGEGARDSVASAGFLRVAACRRSRRKRPGRRSNRGPALPACQPALAAGAVAQVLAWLGVLGVPWPPCRRSSPSSPAVGQRTFRRRSSRQSSAFMPGIAGGRASRRRGPGVPSDRRRPHRRRASGASRRSNPQQARQAPSSGPRRRTGGAGRR